ncbi:MAG: AEC family transporter [Oscillospiraceae bacterium]|nr:AEC family transporter [Oscillospiraceae bacterium]
MSEFLHAVSSVSIILLLAATGYFCADRGWMNDSVKQFLSKFLMTVAIPVNMVYGFTANLRPEDLLMHVQMMLVPLMVIPVLFVLAFAAQHVLKLPRRQAGVFLMMCGLGNTIFVGLPMCLELFGDMATPYVMTYYLVSSSFTQLVGIPLVRWAGEQSKPSFGKMFARYIRTPAVLSVFVGLGLVLLNVQLPPLAQSYAKYINGTITPLAMLLTGYIIHGIGLKNMRIDRIHGTVLAFRFLISPLLCLGVCVLFGVEGLARSVLAVEMAMPIVTQTVVAATEYGADEQLAAQGAALTTLACFVVIPVLMVLV